MVLEKAYRRWSLGNVPQIKKNTSLFKLDIGLLVLILKSTEENGPAVRLN